MPKGSEHNRFMHWEWEWQREKGEGGASCGTSCALKCSDRALHKFVWLCLCCCCCVATSMLHNPIKFSLRLCYFKKQKQQRKRCLICRAAFIDFFSTHTLAHWDTLLPVYTLFLCLPLAHIRGRQLKGIKVLTRLLNA